MGFYSGFKSIGAPAVVAVSKSFAPVVTSHIVAPQVVTHAVPAPPLPVPTPVVSAPPPAPVPAMPLIPRATVSQLLSAPIPKTTAAQPPVALVSKQPATPMPQSIPAGSIVPSPPAGFPAYQIRPELIASPVMKQPVIPGFFDPRTAASLAPQGLVQAVHKNPVIPPGAQPMGPPASVQSIFRNPAIRTANTAIAAAQHAQAQGIVANTASQKAAAAAFTASQAKNHAMMNPTPQAIGASDSSALQAQQAQAASDAAAQAATAAQAQADAAAAAAAAAAQDQANAMTPTDPGFLDPGASPAPDGVPPPPAIDPSTLPVGTTLAYMPPSYTPAYAAGGGAALVGFMLAGPLGALIGAALGGGGGYVYVKHKDDAQTAANMVAPPTPAVPTEIEGSGSNMPMTGPQAQPGTVNGYGQYRSYGRRRY